MKKFSGIILLLTSLSRCFLGGEVGFRFFYPTITQHNDMFRYDELLGWTFVPSKKGLIVYSADNKRLYIETNASGFRDDAFDLENEKLSRLMVMGDSFVSNVSVNHKDVFTEVMERRMKNVSVMNLGVNGYGQVQEYLLLDSMIEKFNPQIIMVQVYIRNDFHENSIRFEWLSKLERPHARLSEDQSEVVITKPDLLQPKKTKINIIDNSHFLTFLRRRIENLTFKNSNLTENPQNMPPEFDLCKKESSELINEAYRVTEIMLLKIYKLCQKRNIPVFFVVAPSFLQVDSDLWKTTLLKYDKNPDHYDLELPNKRLGSFARKNKLPLIDLLPRLKTEKINGRDTYNLHEQHWNKYGNEVVADEIVNRLHSFGELLRALGYTEPRSKHPVESQSDF